MHAFKDSMWWVEEKIFWVCMATKPGLYPRVRVKCLRGNDRADSRGMQRQPLAISISNGRWGYTLRAPKPQAKEGSIDWFGRARGTLQACTYWRSRSEVDDATTDMEFLARHDWTGRRTRSICDRDACNANLSCLYCAGIDAWFINYNIVHYVCHVYTQS
jgi:hypothetical protein